MNTSSHLDLHAQSAELATPSASLSRLLFHNAAMASGELFHSNMLAFLIEVTRPTDGEHELLRSFLQRCGCESWPSSFESLGLARPTFEQVREAAQAEVLRGRLRQDQLTDLQSFFEAHIQGEPAESEHSLTQREAGNFDLVINLHDHGKGHLKTRKRSTRNGSPEKLGLDTFHFSLDGSAQFRLAIENKVKSIATRRQLDDYLCALEGLPGRSRLVLLTLFPYEGGSPSVADVPLSVLTYKDLAVWLRSVLIIESVRKNAPWLSDYIDYIETLAGLSEQAWGCILLAEKTDVPTRVLDQLVKKHLVRCRMFASYQKLYASRMAARLEERLRDLLPIKSVRRKDRWPTGPYLEIYSSYSNQSGVFGVGIVKQRTVGSLVLLETVGVQYQSSEYRPYVAWDWVAKSVASKNASTVTVAPLTVGELKNVDFVRERASELRSLLTDDQYVWSVRNFDHRWRGFVRTVEESPNAVLDRMEKDVRRWFDQLSRS